VANVVLVPSLLSIGLWATFPPDWKWPHCTVFCFWIPCPVHLTPCALFLKTWTFASCPPPRPCRPFTAYTIMQKACYSTATLCQHLNQKYWTGISKGDHAGYRCHGRKGQQVCWTYLSQLGISDGDGVQDEALWKVFHTQVPQRLI
jgi:hypothetical protein